MKFRYKTKNENILIEEFSDCDFPIVIQDDKSGEGINVSLKGAFFVRNSLNEVLVPYEEWYSKLPPHNGMRSIHPGEILREEYLISLEDVRNFLIDTKVSSETLVGLIDEKIDIDEKLAELLGKHFGTTKEFWLNMQNSFDSKK